MKERNKIEQKTIYVCWYSFTVPDPKNPRFALSELDLYRNVSLRKKLGRDEFQIYDRQSGNVMFEGNFKDALGEMTTCLHEKGLFLDEIYKPCEHVAGKMDSHCLKEHYENEWKKTEDDGL